MVLTVHENICLSVDQFALDSHIEKKNGSLMSVTGTDMKSLMDYHAVNQVNFVQDKETCFTVCLEFELRSNAWVFTTKNKDCW